MKTRFDVQVADLNAVQDRLQNSDLIPSQEPLLDGLSEKMAALNRTGIQSLANLRIALKTAKSLSELAEKSGVDASYLQLLRRAINGFFPKPRPLREIDWLAEPTRAALKKIGIKNTQHLVEAARDEGTRLATQIGVDQNEMQELLAISNLCRIQWVSPSFARALVAAGVTTPAAVAAADPDILVHQIEAANQKAKFYKGKIGLRDVRRLVAAAAYVA